MVEKIRTIPEFIGYIRTKLGEPKVRVELANSHIEANLSDAVNFYREYARDNGNQRGYLVVDMEKGERLYTLPENIMAVGAVKQGPSGNTSAWVLATMSGAMASDALSLRTFDMVSYTMLNHWIKYLRAVTRSQWRFLFNNNNKELTVMPTPSSNLRLFLSVYRENSVEEMLNDQFIREYALAMCKVSLGTIRKKFGSLPGFGGSVSLDGSDMVSEGKEEMKVLEDDLIVSFKYSRPPLPVFHGSSQ